MPPPWLGNTSARPITTWLRSAIGATASRTPTAHAAISGSGFCARLRARYTTASPVNGNANSKFGRPSKLSPEAIPRPNTVIVRAPRTITVFGLGIASGLSLLGRPNLLLALPFTGLAVVYLARKRAQKPLPLMAACAVGVLLAVAPMALRNQVVIGRADVFPSHGGGIPFYIGNNPHANGRWNDAGGLLTGQVARERIELADK